MKNIELVIKIPEEEYKLCKRQYDTECLDTLMIAVKYGIPLPEHHGDLKDVDKIKEEAIDMSQWGSDTAYGVWVEDIDATPTIIPATKKEKLSCDTCKHKDKKYQEFPCIDCLEKDRYEEGERMREATKEERESINNHIKSISQKVITIPVGATNGDVIKALFPDSEVEETQGLVPKVCFESHSGEQCISFFDTSWWNAPYKKAGDGNE